MSLYSNFGDILSAEYKICIYRDNTMQWWLVLWCKGSREPLKRLLYICKINYDWLSWAQQTIWKLFIEKEENVFCRRQVCHCPLTNLCSALWTGGGRIPILILFARPDTWQANNTLYFETQSICATDLYFHRISTIEVQTCHHRSILFLFYQSKG